MRGRWAKVGIAVGLGGAAALGAAALHVSEPARTALALPAGKTVARLGGVAEAGPAARPERLHDTLAMFALPQADARTWTERPSAAPSGALTAAERERAAAKAPLPRFAQAELDGARRSAPLPPSRPAVAAAAEAPVAAPTVAAATAPEPVRVLGWAVPGSERLPSGSEAAAVVSGAGGLVVRAGGATVEAGGRAATAGLDAAAALGREASALGGRVAEAVGLR